VEVDRLAMAKPDRIRAYRVDDLCSGRVPARDDVPDIFQWTSLRFAMALDELEKRERIDFVEFFEYCGPGYYSFARRLYGRSARPGPVLGCRLHGSIEVLERFGEGLARERWQLSQFAFEQASMGLAEAVLAPSRSYYLSYYKPLYGLPDSKVVVSSPPKQAFPAAGPGPAAGAPFSIAFVGRLFHIKGVDQFVHASVILMKERPDLDFVVDLVGYDSVDTPFPGAGANYSHYLKTLIPQRLRDRFRFHGQLPHAKIAELLGSALFAVFPNRIESFCYALHEVYDAGVPVIINALPAFTDFFEHERNCLAFNGDTPGLLACMRRLVEDRGLRDRLRRPYPVADHPIGPFYDAPAALAPIAPVPGASPKPLVIVLGSDGSDVRRSPAAASLAASAASGQFEAVYLVPAPPDGEETLWWLGSSWHCRDAADAPIEPSDIRTTDALVVLLASDTLSPDWLSLCGNALARRPELAFAGTWSMTHGRVTPTTIDLLPELAPFDQPSRLHRVMLRTDPDQFLCDLLDTTLGPMGHVGAIWEAVGRHGRGIVLPEPLIGIGDHDPLRPEPLHLKSLVMRHGDHFARSLALLAPMVAEQLGAAHARLPSAAPSHPAPPPAEFTVETKIRIADELGGRTLAKLAFQKFSRRVRGR
ncbi:MAG: glycosyltransferase family 4 protein, partial [Phycisphaerales bacterium]